VNNGPLVTVDTVQALHSVIGTRFTTTATQSTASADLLRRAGSAYPTLITRDFLDLKDDSTGGAATIRALAKQWTSNATNAYDKASIIESTLRNPQLFRYTLKPPTPPPITKSWPVTFFLTTTHAGYCQYYAVAMGTMLRALGIPSRLINGYGPGTAPNAATRRTTSEDIWNVSSNDAHTWVEAYFPDYGWIPFEPTPPSQAGDYQPFVRGSVVGTGPNHTGTTPAPTATAKPSRSNAQLPVGAGSTSGGGRAVVVGLAGFAGAVLVVFALLAAWFLRPRDVRGVWRRVGIVGRLLGVSRDRALTFDEYVERLTAALPPGAQRASGTGAADPWAARLAAGLRDIAAISDRTFYSSAGAGPDVAHLKRAWRRVALISPRLGRRVARAQPAP
jgi:transglutaminase-like putative cysteine protease